MASDAARDIARRVGLDLVEISPNAKPPVCKIMDYGRYKYELKKKAATAKKSQHQSQVKEVKFRPQIDDHDLDFKLKNARKFLFEGDKVKCTVMFRGREIVHSQLGRDLLRRVGERLDEIASIESYPQMEGRTLSMTVAPNRSVIARLKAAEARLAEAEDVAEAEGVAEAENVAEEETDVVNEEEIEENAGESEARDEEARPAGDEA
jgi:translation initiation factor IF-3